MSKNKKAKKAATKKSSVTTVTATPKPKTTTATSRPEKLDTAYVGLIAALKTMQSELTNANKLYGINLASTLKFTGRTLEHIERDAKTIGDRIEKLLTKGDKATQKAARDSKRIEKLEAQLAKLKAMVN